MKKIILLMITAMVILVSAGCNDPQQPKEDDGNPAVENPAGTQNEGYPDSVQKTVEAIKNIKAATTVKVGDKTFIIVSFGQSQETDVVPKLVEIKDGNEKTVVVVGQEQKTDKNSDISYMITEIENGDKKVDFQYEDEDGYLPIVYGMDNIEPNKVIVGKNIELLDMQSDSKGVHVSGIASIWEASFLWELQDQDGNVLKEGHVMAYAGAPDWGSFTLDITKGNLPENASSLVFLEESAKTGEGEEILKVDLNQ